MFTHWNKAVFLLILAGASVWIMTPDARSETLKNEYRSGALSVVQGGALLSYHPVVAEIPVLRKKITVTAYTSSVDETDDTPDLTAWGTKTRTGVIAANFLPFGTKIRLPGLFGNKIFTVEDRMNERFKNRLDVWLPTKGEAKQFGLQITEVEIEL